MGFRMVVDVQDEVPADVGWHVSVLFLLPPAHFVGVSLKYADTYLGFLDLRLGGLLTLAEPRLCEQGLWF